MFLSHLWKKPVHQLGEREKKKLTPTDIDRLAAITASLLKIVAKINPSSDDPESGGEYSLKFPFPSGSEGNSDVWQIWMAVCGRTTVIDWICDADDAYKRLSHPSILEMQRRLYAIIWAECERNLGDEDPDWWTMRVELSPAQTRAVLQAITLSVDPHYAYPLPLQMLDQERIPAYRPILWMRYNLCRLIIDNMPDDRARDVENENVPPNLGAPDYNSDFVIASSQSNPVGIKKHVLRPMTRAFIQRNFMLDFSPTDVVRYQAYLNNEVWTIRA